MEDRAEDHVPTRCGLAAAVGRHERCPGRRCPLWEEGRNRRAPAGCAIERVAPHLKTRPELALYLLELRAELSGLGDDV